MSRRPNQAVRARIVRIARDLYHQRGLAAVSMETVAAAAGLKKANLFHYFPTRDALQLEVIEQVSQGMREEMRARFARARHPIRAVARLFDEARAGMRQQGCRGGCLLGNLAQELSDQDEPARRKLAEHLAFWRDLVAGLLDHGRRTGFFRTALPARGAAEAILALFEGSLLFSKAHRTTEAIVSARRMAVGYLEGFRAR
jgi:TetR/AcrR family transcriptional regulator, transcriptional repressor for nem operon